MSLIPFRTNLATKQVYDPLRNFRSEFDRLFDDFFTQLPTTKQEHSPLADIRIDVSETDSEIRLRAELPGLEEKDIDLELTRDVLTLRGEKRFQKEEDGRNYHLVECSYGSFSRTIRLPFEAESKDVSATYKNGLLTVSIQKPVKKKEETQKITVRQD